MGRINFYVLWSLRDAPRQFISKSNRRCFHVHVPLPLPKQLVIFGLGEWGCSETTVSVEVVVSADVLSQNIGTLTSQARCLTFEGDWNSDTLAVAAERGRKGVYGKIVLKFQEPRSTLNSTPLVKRECLFPEQLSITDLSCTSHQSAAEDTVTPNTSQLGDSVCYGEIHVNKVDTSDSALVRKSSLWPMDETPKRTAISSRRRLPWSAEKMEISREDIGRASTPKKMRFNSKEEMTVQIKEEDREVSVFPSKRWSHSMCLIDPDTVILIGGETLEENFSKDSLWKLELDNDLWYQMNSSTSGPAPPCTRGFSATYDPDSKTILVYGGLREGQRYSELYILNTLTWKWKLVTAKGNIPSLAYHSAAFYEKELFVFGGVHPRQSSRDKLCSNALYIFNPDFELWYQPIVEGDKPLPRFGHSATLLSQKLIIFGGRTTATYLNDLHVLDLGFMEYTAVKCENMPPLPRGFHAALPVSDNKILVNGGCSTIGPLQDVHVFNTDTNMWGSMALSELGSKPRAGHSLILLSSSTLAAEQDRPVKVHCTLLVFGGSDCSGNFYNDTVKCTLEIPL
nr:rab9 effector protein with kelch motifs-like isoform X1 [Nerophis lumbriciformis]